MSLDDAAMRVEATQESFVVFRNADTDAVSILYRRKDGNLGLIEPD
jgi:putative sigma-54 modulation protein